MKQRESFGTLAANGNIFLLDVRELDTLGIQVTGAMTATLQFEGTIDGINWFALNAVPKDSSTPVTSATAAGVWFANVGALLAARVRCSAYTSGSPTIGMRATEGGHPAPAGTSGSSGSSGTGNLTNIVNGSFTRPNDTTAYASGDAMTDSTSAPTIINFANVASANNKGGVIIGATLIDSANQSTKGLFDLFIFDTTATPDNDNSAFTPTDAELATLVGVISFDTPINGDATSGAGGNAVYPAVGLNLPFKTGASSRDLFGLLVARNAYTPVAQEVFTVRLNVLQDPT